MGGNALTSRFVSEWWYRSSIWTHRQPHACPSNSMKYRSINLFFESLIPTNRKNGGKRIAFSLVGWFTAFHMLPMWYLRVVINSNWQRWWQKRTKHANTKNMICNTGMFRTRKNDSHHPVQHEDNNGVDSSSTEDIDVIFGRSVQNKRKKYEYLSLLLFFVVYLGKVLAYATHIHE